MKRYITSLLFVLLMLQTALPSFANNTKANEKPMLVYTALNYEEQSVGDIPNGFTWYGLDSEADITGVSEVSGIGNSSKRCMRIQEGVQRDTGSFFHGLSYAGINKINNHGQYVISLKVMTEDTDSAKILSMHYNADTPSATDMIYKAELSYNLLEIRNSITALGRTLVDSVEANQWYDIALTMNFATKQADVYLGGQKQYSVTLAADTINVDSLRFHIPDKRSGSARKNAWCIDDVRIYAADAPVSNEEFASIWEQYQTNEWIPSEDYSITWLRRYDKFCYLALYDRFVMALDGRRFYKNNQFYDLPVPVEMLGDTYIVPLKAFAESFGATVAWNPDDRSITVAKGTDELICTIGSDIFYINGIKTKSMYPLTINEGNACVPLEILAVMFDIKPYRQDKLVALDGKPIQIEWSYDDVIKTNRNLQSFEEAVIEQIYYGLMFNRPTAEQIVEAYQKQMLESTKRPKLYTEPDTFDFIKQTMETDEDLKTKVNKMLALADEHLKEPVVQYTLWDGLRATFPNELNERCQNLSFAYRITGDAKYKDKLWENLEAASKFPDFNEQNHFLGLGTAGNGVVVAYDWLYDEWAKEPEKLETLETMMLNFVLMPIIKGSKGGYLDVVGTPFIMGGANQACVINNAGICAAINLMDKYPELCSDYISTALRFLERPFMVFYPDGGYEEGASYWSYVNITLPFTVESLQNALGNDFGLGTVKGLEKTAYFPIMISGTEGSFNFGDSSEAAGSYDSAQQWYAKEYNDESMAVLRANNTANFGVKDVLYHIPDIDKNAEVVTEKDTLYEKLGTVTMRSGWSDSDMVVLLHGGRVNEAHGHEDNGTFMLDAFGERWACELPKEDYNMLMYGSYVYEPGMAIQTEFLGKFLRAKAEGHNTVVANLGNNGPNDMVQTAESKIIKFASEEAGSYAICDMTETNKVYECALRGVKLDRITQDVVLQDNFRAEGPTDFHWFMNTRAEVELTNGGRSAILTLNGKRMWVSIISDDPELKFETYDAVPLPLYTAPPKQTANDGYRRLMIHKADATEFKVSVAFKQLLEGQTEPSVLPVDSPMETWKFTSHPDDIATLSNLTMNGETIKGFNKNVRNYSVKLPTEKSDIPVISASTDSGCKLDIIEATSLPGVTTIVLTDDEGRQKGVYNVTFRPINDSTKFLNDKQIPIIDYEVSSEPQTENGVVNLFDANMTTRFSTDEYGGTVALDFGESVELAEVKMAFLDGATRKEFFTIETSEDNINWTMIEDDGASCGTTTDYQSFTFEPVKARYLRIKFYGNEASAWVSVTELCAFRK